jgi:hypothetical protein
MIALQVLVPRQISVDRIEIRRYLRGSIECGSNWLNSDAVGDLRETQKLYSFSEQENPSLYTQKTNRLVLVPPRPIEQARQNTEGGRPNETIENAR